MTKTVAIVQARMGSTRLPGKVLIRASGRSMLWHMLRRLRECHEIDEIVVATTLAERDEAIVHEAERCGVRSFRGSEDDVLDRYYRAAFAHDADAVVRVTSDCPLIDPDVVDRVVATFRGGEYDYVSTNHPATFPDGLDTEVFSFDALREAWAHASHPHEREHVSPYIWDNPERFRIGNVAHEVDLSQRERWTLDYPEDAEFLVRIIDALHLPDGPCFRMRDVLAFLHAHPEVRAINAKHVGVNWYAKHWGALRTRETLATRPSEVTR